MFATDFRTFDGLLLCQNVELDGSADQKPREKIPLHVLWLSIPPVLLYGFRLVRLPLNLVVRARASAIFLTRERETR